MSFDFRKLLSAEESEKITEPRALFQSLSRSKGYEYLRGVQEDVLDQWHSRRDEADLIIKMNTGSGKTIVGLTILQSRLNEGKGPALYLCPDPQLVRQVVEQSRLVGVPCVEFGEGNEIPVLARNSKAILVTTLQKLFNGRTVFGLAGSPNAVRIGSVLVDDAHTCLAQARRSFTAVIPRTDPAGKQLFALFRGALLEQSLGTGTDLINEDPTAYMLVPYWTWLDNSQTIAQIMSEAKESDALNFVWNFLKNCLEDCYCVVSGTHIEIGPRSLPTSQIPSFNNAAHRVFMSATIVDDSALIRDFGVKPAAAKAPLKPKTTGDIGERMIIAPGLIDPNLDNAALFRGLVALPRGRDVNVVVLVTSRQKASRWVEAGATLIDKTNIDTELSKLQNTKGNLAVLLNRYDGIDLPEDACRVLVMDGRPAWSTLSDRYIAGVRGESALLTSQEVQRVEQGLGRAVRSQGDYCAVFLLGNDLTSFVSLDQNRAFMTPETAAQIDMGIEFASILAGAASPSMKAIGELVDLFLNRDSGWIEYHKKRLLKAAKGNPDLSDRAQTLATAEREASQLFLAGRYDEAANKIAQAKDGLPALDSERAWYEQLEATYVYRRSPDAAFEKQLHAHSLNTQLLKAPTGTRYRKLTAKRSEQAHRILRWLTSFREANGIVASATTVLDRLAFGMPAPVFEPALMQMVSILGYEAQRPDHEYRVGPDVLWHLGDGAYLLVEAKSFAKPERTTISKREAGQITQHELWFKENYPGQTGMPVVVHPTRDLAADAYLPEGSMIMLPAHLSALVDAGRRFVAALATRQVSAWSAEEVSTLLVEHKLDANSVQTRYLTPPKN